MQIGNTHYGQHVEGTHLTRHGIAPRRSAQDRAPMAWYECELCNQIKCIRIARVRPGCTVSCGCKARKHFTAHYQQRADNLSKKVRKLLFETAKTRNNRKRVCIAEIARRGKLDPYTVCFAIAAHCALLRGLKALSKSAESVMSKVERSWLRWYLADLAAKEGPSSDHQRAAYLDSLHWRDRLRYLAMERRVNAARIPVAGLERWLIEHQAQDDVVIEPPWRPLDQDDMIFI